MELREHWNMNWHGWTLSVDGLEIGTIKADTANGYRLHLNESLPPIGWHDLTFDTLGEAEQSLLDFANAQIDQVELGEATFDGSAFKPAAVVWQPI